MNDGVAEDEKRIPRDSFLAPRDEWPNVEQVMDTDDNEFGNAMRDARVACGLTRVGLAKRIGNGTTAIYRWEKGTLVPALESRLRVVNGLKNAPRPMLERLARAADVSLPPAPVAAAPASQGTPEALGASVQSLVDDALREAAEDADVSPKLLRPALSRMLDRLAKARVPMDAAARMVLGVPKKEAGGDGKSDAKLPGAPNSS